MPGLLWLNDRFVETASFCLTFVRGSAEAEVFAAFGADPAEAVPRTRQQAEDADADPALGYGPSVRVGRSGEWLFAWEESSSEGRRAEVLRRVSACGDAVAVTNAVGAFASFGYAAAGEVVTSIDTIAPFTRQGVAPDRFLPLVEDAGLGWPPGPQSSRRLTGLHAVLTIAERALGVSLSEAEVDQALPCARILPVLPDPLSSPHHLPGRPPPFGDRVVDLLLANADEKSLIVAAETQILGMLADSGLDRDPVLAQAVQDVADGDPPHLDNDTRPAVVLRRIMREGYEATRDGYPRPLRMTQEERRMRSTRKLAADVLQRVLTWGPLPALPAVLEYRVAHGDAGWRDQLLSDLAGTQVPEAELREAERRDWEPTS